MASEELEQSVCELVFLLVNWCVPAAIWKVLLELVCVPFPVWSSQLVTDGSPIPGMFLWRLCCLVRHRHLQVGHNHQVVDSAQADVNCISGIGVALVQLPFHG